jgi:thiamine biosynthesis lipoprotein
VTVAASSAVAANTASTAAIVLGVAAPDWLREQGLAARLVGNDGEVSTIGDWPTVTAVAAA